MEAFVLQNIVFSNRDMSGKEDLYFRGGGDWDQCPQTGALLIRQGGQVRFDTYFNGLSLPKWRQYTRVGEIGLRLDFRGELTLRILSVELEGQALKEKEHGVHRLASDQRDSVTLELPEITRGILYFELTGQGREAAFFGGSYITWSRPNPRPVKIGVIICTYRREDFLQQNVAALDRLKRDCPILKDHLEVLIVDNGQTLEARGVEREGIRLYPNKNAGGSGGFTRGLMELMDRGSEGFSHGLLMDDDILLEPESLFRTWSFLSYVRPGYQEVFIGGSMLRMDRPSILVESGARWQAGRLESLKSNRDMSRVEDLLINEISEDPEYHAWWYCTIPLSIVSGTNLPLPLFIRGDDIEYGLRNMEDLVILNGIGVWHEVFENKYASYLEYYIVRNLLINNTLHYPDYHRWRFLRFLYPRILRMILTYRYQEVKLVLEGVSDFLKGIDWLSGTDPEKRHKGLVGRGYIPQPLNLLSDSVSFEKVAVGDGSLLGKWLRILSVNGMLLKSRRDVVVPVVGFHMGQFYRADRVLNLDGTGQRGFITRKSYREGLMVLVELLRTTGQILRHYDRAQKEYRERKGEITNRIFWRRHLDLE